MHHRGDVLIAKILDGANGESANELLKELFDGYPVPRLSTLLGSDHPRSVELGAWLLSELGVRAAPLMSEMERLLEHRSHKVRFFTLDSVLVTAAPEDGNIVAKAVQLIRDADSGVRWKAMHFLARATVAQLSAAVPHSDRGGVASQLSWLLEAERIDDAGLLVARLDDADRTWRLFAGAVAARRADYDDFMLRQAVASADSEVKSFATDYLRSLHREERR